MHGSEYSASVVSVSFGTVDTFDSSKSKLKVKVSLKQCACAKKRAVEFYLFLAFSSGDFGGILKHLSILLKKIFFSESSLSGVCAF